MQPAAADEERGLHFICTGREPLPPVRVRPERLGPEHQVRGLFDETDPLLGSRTPRPGVAEISVARPAFAGLAEENDPRFARAAFAPPVPAGDVFSMPRRTGRRGASPACRSSSPCAAAPYFFLPGLRALRYIAGAPRRRRLVPPPPAPTLGRWQPVLRALHRGLELGLHAERRLEPFFRPAFNRAFREPLAGLLQYLINRRRPDEGLGLPRSASLPTRRRA